MICISNNQYLGEGHLNRKEMIILRGKFLVGIRVLVGHQVQSNMKREINMYMEMILVCIPPGTNNHLLKSYSVMINPKTNILLLAKNIINLIMLSNLPKMIMLSK